MERGTSVEPTAVLPVAASNQLVWHYLLFTILAHKDMNFISIKIYRSLKFQIINTQHLLSECIFFFNQVSSYIFSLLQNNPDLVLLSCKTFDVNYNEIIGTCDEICDVFTAVGLTVVEVVKQPVRCTTAFSCPSSCELGYKCGSDGCPTCECLIAVPMGKWVDIR